MKRILYWFLALALVLSVFPLTAWGAESEPSDQGDGSVVVHEEAILQSDGSVLDIRVVAYPSRAGHYQDGSITYTYRNTSGVAQWAATLSATFYYNGSISSCTTASLSITFKNNSFYKVSGNASWSGNTATANYTIGYKVLGVTIGTTAYSLTLSCDKDGHLSGNYT